MVEFLKCENIDQSSHFLWVRKKTFCLTNIFEEISKGSDVVKYILLRTFFERRNYFNGNAEHVKIRFVHETTGMEIPFILNSSPPRRREPA